MRYLSCLLFVFLAHTALSQTKNYLDVSYLETSGTIDTLVIPDKIYLNILITEKDTKGKMSVEELKGQMAAQLKALGIDLKKQLSLADVSSNFKKYFLKQTDILKAKSYSLLVYDAKTAGQVIIALEKENISNVELDRGEYSKIEALKIELKSLAMQRAKQNAMALVKPLNQKIGPAIHVSDLSGSLNALSGRVSGVVVRGYASKTQLDPVDIEFKKIKVESAVNVKFKLE
jgi:uncharacterized protein YggE